MSDALARVQVADYRVTKREELFTHEHHSVSPEFAMAIVHSAREQFAVPAQEQTKQVRWIGGVAVLVVLVGVIGCVVRPEAATQIAAICAVVEVVFGGIYYVGERRKR